MNCQQFTTLIIEAARGRMMDAASRDGALRHADACDACAARLEQEQRLTKALRSVAADMKDQSAPARVEAQLLAAFRENLAASQATTADASRAGSATGAGSETQANAARPVALALAGETAASFSSQRRVWRVLTTAIAATLALAALVTLYKQFTQITPSTQTPTIASNAPQQGTSPAPVAPDVNTHAPAANTHAQSPNNSTVQTSQGQTGRVRSQTTQLAATQRTQARGARLVVPRMIASRQVIDGGRAVFAEDEGERADNHAGGAPKPGEAERVTEFIPLVAGAPDAQPLESGQLVRVQLPRAALASLGLPLNAERGNEPVKADVLLGNDGLARAIRFVH